MFIKYEENDIAISKLKNGAYFTRHHDTKGLWRKHIIHHPDHGEIGFIICVIGVSEWEPIENCECEKVNVVNKARIEFLVNENKGV